jgi:Fic/DOC family
MQSQIRFPAIKHVDHKIFETIDLLNAEIVGFQARQPHSICAIGLEQRSALLALQGFDFGICPDNGFWKAKCKSLFVRPSAEPSTYLFRNIFMNEIDAGIMDHIAAALTGFRVKRREGRAFASSSTGDVEFEDFITSQAWLDDLKNASSQIDQRLFPYYLYLRIIAAHPYQDGNGRLARFFLIAAMSKGLKNPILHLPIAPAIYMRSNALAAAIQIASQCEDWSVLMTCLVTVIHDSIRMANKTYEYLDHLVP